MPKSESALKKSVHEMSVGMLVKGLTVLKPWHWENKGEKVHVQFYGYYEELPWDDFLTCAQAAFDNHLLAAVGYHIEQVAAEQQARWTWNVSYFGTPDLYSYSVYGWLKGKEHFWHEFGDSPAEAAVRTLVTVLRDKA